MLDDPRFAEARDALYASAPEPWMKETTQDQLAGAQTERFRPLLTPSMGRRWWPLPVVAVVSVVVIPSPWVVASAVCLPLPAILGA